MNLLKLTLGIWLGKFLLLLSQLRGSRGTAMPGLVVERLFPNFLELARPYLGKLVVVTGTNGKTSTQTLLAHSLRQLQPGKVLVNSRGANLSRGLVAEICRSFSVLPGESFAYSVFEVEEATFPKIAAALKPDILLITNFFRDQLDAYGEINRTKQHVVAGAQKSGDVKIIANGDDPQILELHSLLSQTAEVDYVSLAGGESINYEQSNLKLPNLSELKVTSYSAAEITESLGCRFNYRGLQFELALPGFYSYYAFALTSSALDKLGVLNSTNIGDYQNAVITCKPAFGRGEILQLNAQGNSKNVQLFLIKNPVGFNLTLDLISELKSGCSLGILINDKIADGRDVSWLWDSNLEKLATIATKGIVVGGERALDMNLRLKYAVKSQVKVAKDLNSFVDMLSSEEGPLKLLATYTAMNQVRDLLLTRANISDK